jgi:hypothetical protein
MQIITWSVGCDGREQHSRSSDGSDVVQPVQHAEQLALPVAALPLHAAHCYYTLAILQCAVLS